MLCKLLILDDVNFIPFTKTVCDLLWMVCPRYAITVLPGLARGARRSATAYQSRSSASTSEFKSNSINVTDCCRILVT